MSNQTFLISVQQNNHLSQIALAQLRMDLDEHPLHQRDYVAFASLPGNGSKYNLDALATNTVSPLYGKRILFLGSSVTFGFGALAESFVDDLWKKDGIRAIKDAENGTTLVARDRYQAGDSYVARLRQELSKGRPDAFVLQLSTNDAVTNQPLGQLAKKEPFDVHTITGALQAMITSVQHKWHCPILLYSNPDFGNAAYERMVKRAQVLAKHYHLAFLNMNADPRFSVKKKLYMADRIHPTRAGYIVKWTPAFEDQLTRLLA